MLSRPIRVILGAGLLLVFVVAAFAATHADGRDRMIRCRKAPPAKLTIGATASIVEKTWGVVIPARVDTGAHTCSLDAEKVEVAGEVADKRQNIGKTIRFLMRDGDERKDWIESTIASCATIMTADDKESLRYEVRLTLAYHGFEKEVLVTLNDRADLDYPLLVGRNFLFDDFVVDVSLDNHDKTIDD
jgi:hypothetical protein